MLCCMPVPLFVSISPCQRQSHNDGRGVLSLLLHHCWRVTWGPARSWHTVARCAQHKSIAHMQEYVTVFSQNTCHFGFRRSHWLRMQVKSVRDSCHRKQKALSSQGRGQPLGLDSPVSQSSPKGQLLDI